LVEAVRSNPHSALIDLDLFRGPFPATRTPSHSHR
jgi:hypothetical protein